MSGCFLFQSTRELTPHETEHFFCESFSATITTVKPRVHVALFWISKEFPSENSKLGFSLLSISFCLDVDWVCDKDFKINSLPVTSSVPSTTLDIPSERVTECTCWRINGPNSSSTLLRKWKQLIESNEMFIQCTTWPGPSLWFHYERLHLNQLGIIVFFFVKASFQKIKSNRIHQERLRSLVRELNFNLIGTHLRFQTWSGTLRQGMLLTFWETKSGRTSCIVTAVRPQIHANISWQRSLLGFDQQRRKEHCPVVLYLCTPDQACTCPAVSGLTLWCGNHCLLKSD